MAFNNSDNNEAIADINVVPLVDIILVVLIIFMVTAPMFMKPTINVNLPKAASGDQTAPSKLNIALTADGRINLNGTFVSEEDVRAKATEEVGKNADVQAIISADKDVPHGKVVGLLDIVKGSGVKKFAISIDKK
ncbi:biopolymer transporter ExbD [Bdellovibrio bacteriovorus]|uniref:TonB system transport protein ExbD2 n=1 Tax=Bdellovibrio bacteriovorus (strain ATCC 15356 / DSM 50701 / NCIMB 9529 / HD100) TaxID=264462 RepID=Q6MQI8_BDEBA|nr:biopolymer transporter ExbD [Bdellovibrio bacteriovorus]AHZ86093.1 biopolymer transporter ExbD [Bdellovibrio bacteriovorus]BEV67018.1 Biopolymer transport protein ExbD [Bdellovibrio bacteriovorus]CAE78459.1 TonB system transport protein ExbD2 [Bdellovibrio bacteriovorus HD100]